MKPRLDQTLLFIDAVEQTQNAAELEDCLMGLAASFGFTTIFGGIVPTRRVPPAEVAARTLFQRVPPEWAERYNSRGYLFRDPIVHRLGGERAPFSWHDAYSTSVHPDDVKLIQGESYEFGLRDGYVIPISMLEGDLAAISFGGPSADISTADLSMLNFAASYALGTYLHRRERRRRLDPHLSGREYDCLLWAGEGKTDWEISVILGISRSTVIKHIVSARDKLGAVNKAHAIAKAIRTKLLR